MTPHTIRAMYFTTDVQHSATATSTRSTSCAHLLASAHSIVSPLSLRCGVTHAHDHTPTSPVPVAQEHTCTHAHAHTHTRTHTHSLTHTHSHIHLHTRRPTTPRATATAHRHRQQPTDMHHISSPFSLKCAASGARALRRVHAAWSRRRRERNRWGYRSRDCACSSISTSKCNARFAGGR